jgi:hypothetical protein
MKPAVVGQHQKYGRWGSVGHLILTKLTDHKESVTGAVLNQIIVPHLELLRIVG